MTNSQKLYEILTSLLLQSPSVLAILSCLVAAFVRWKRHPRVSLTVVIALVLFLVFTLIFPFIFTFVPDLFRKPGDDFRSVQTVISVISFFYNSLWAIALAILLVAIFMQRNRATSDTAPS